MASNKALVPEAKAALDKFKMEAASEVGVTLNQGYNGELTSKQAGSIGGQMVKKMVEKYENEIKTKSRRLSLTVLRRPELRSGRFFALQGRFFAGCAFS